MRLLLTRHGRTAANVNRELDTAYPGSDLDATGREQAEALVDRLADEPVKAVFASDLVRTQQTATPLAQARGLPVRVLPGLKEIQAGDHEMSTEWQVYIEALQAWGEDLDHRVPGGESGTEFFARYDAAIGEVAGAGLDTVLVVSHGAAMRVWASARCENVPAGWVAQQAMPNTNVLVLEGDPQEGWRLLWWGDEPVPDAAEPGLA